MNTVHKCFKMKLFKGFENEYKKRHDELWSEMIDMIHEYGGSNYSIFLDGETNYLYGYIELKDAKLWDKSSETAICKKWWNYMSDIMETNEDNSPISIELKSMFYLK